MKELRNLLKMSSKIFQSNTDKNTIIKKKNLKLYLNLIYTEINEHLSFLKDNDARLSFINNQKEIIDIQLIALITKTKELKSMYPKIKSKEESNDTNIHLSKLKLDYLLVEYVKTALRGVRTYLKLKILAIHLAERESSVIIYDELQKIKWLGTPSQFSHIFTELAKRGFIEIPPTRGQGSSRKFAKMLFQYFDIKTTEDNLISEFQKESSLTYANKSMFSIPDIKDIK